MGRQLFEDDEIRAVARAIAEERGVSALTRDLVRVELSRLAAERGVERYRGDTTRIWRLTDEVKRQNAQPAAEAGPASGQDGMPTLPVALQRLLDGVTAAIQRELAAVRSASEERAQQMLEAANHAADLRESELRERMAELEAEVESSCRSSDAVEEALETAEQRIGSLEARLERSEEERRQLHAAHATQLTELREDIRRAHEARTQAESAAQSVMADFRQLKGRSDAEREARERAEAVAADLRDRTANAVAELERVRGERATLAAECDALRRALGPLASAQTAVPTNGVAADPPPSASARKLRERGRTPRGKGQEVTA